MTPEEQKELDEKVRKKIEDDKVEEAGSCSAGIIYLGAIIYPFVIIGLAGDDFDFAAKIVIGTWVITFCISCIISYLIRKKNLLKKDNLRKKMVRYYLLGFFVMLFTGSSLSIFLGLFCYAVNLFLK